MKRIQSLSIIIKAAFLWLLFSALWCTVKADNPPFAVKANLFDQTQPDNLGLARAEGTETFTVFQPVDSTDHYSNGVVMTAFKDWLYCQWQSSAKDEDAQDTWVAYSRSQDGKNWSSPMILAATIDEGFCSSGGWWVAGDTLVAYINVWPSNVSPRGGYTYYATSTDGLNWSQLKPLLMANGDTLKGIFEQDPHALPDGRILGAAHFQPGLISAPIYTDYPSGMRGWIRAPFPHLAYSGDVSREIEPSWFLRSDDTIVMVFRDQNSTFRRLASVSGDRGETWSTPVVTDMPDSRAKQSAGNLADSAAFMVGNPVNNKTRIPLAIALSRDGKFFNTAYVLREGGDDLQAQRYMGQSKSLGYSYPKSMVWQDTLYVSYSVNKEDVQYTRVPLTSLIIDTSTTVLLARVLSESGNIEILAGADDIIRISMQGIHDEGTIRIFNLNGQLLYSIKVNRNEMFYDMNNYPSGLYIINVRTNSEGKTLLFSKR